jgi:hypothetical protein
VAEQGRSATDPGWRVLSVACLIILLAACSSGDDATAPTTTTVRGGSGPDATDDGATIDDTVPPAEKPVVDPVPIDAVGEFGDGVTAQLTAVDDVDVEAFMPGELSGPGVAITIEVTNGSGEPINLDNVTVDLVEPPDVSATLITTHEDTSLRGDLAPGATATGTYEFTIAADARADVSVRVTYAAPKPTVVFEGSLADV